LFKNIVLVEYNIIQLINLGFVSYEYALQLQEKLFAKNFNCKKNGEQTSNYLIICEHPHVYTMGRGGDAREIDIANLKKHGADFYEVNRGGKITYHGPGQLVVYPILDLENFSLNDVHFYLRQLEKVVISTLHSFNISAGTLVNYTGVWLEPDRGDLARKICAIGVRVSRWLTMHGLALNINTDLSYFEHIIPCGIKDKKVTSMFVELGRQVNMSEVVKILLLNFQKVINCRIVPYV
jgi:lipoyl(octanoyl) transferase